VPGLGGAADSEDNVRNVGGFAFAGDVFLAEEVTGQRFGVEVRVLVLVAEGVVEEEGDEGKSGNSEAGFENHGEEIDGGEEDERFPSLERILDRVRRHFLSLILKKLVKGR